MRLRVAPWALAVAVLAAAALDAQRAEATTFTWTGATNANWSVAGNWLGGTAPGANATLVFPSGASNLATNNDLASATITAITLSGSGYTLSGNAVTLGGTISDSSSGGSNDIVLPIATTAVRTVSVTNAAETLTIDGVFSGAGGITKSGAGTLVLNGTNTYAGITTISTGTLQIGADANLGAAPGSARATSITLSGGTLATTATFALNVTRGMTLTKTSYLDVAAATTLTYGGVVASASTADALTKADAGTLVLSGANTYPGKTNVTGGTLSISSDANLGAYPASATTGSLTFNGGNLVTTASFALNSNRGIAFTQNATIAISAGTTLTYAGKAAGTGTGPELIDTGTLALGGVIAYTGDTLIDAGTLQLGVDGALSAKTDVVIAGSGTLDLAGSSDAIGSLAGSGTVENSSATAATLTANGDNASTAFSGTIENGTGALALAKAGTGTLTLTGTNSYGGGTTLTAGALSISSDANLGAVPGAATPGNITFSGGSLSTTATFALAANRGLTFASAASVDVASGTTLTYDGIAASTGAFSKLDTGTLVFGGVNTYTGKTTLAGGSFVIVDDSGFGTAPGSTTTSDITFNGGTLVTNATMTLATTRGIAFTQTGTIDVAAGTVLTYGGKATGTGNGLTKVDTGTLVLAGANTYSGGTTIAAGTIQLGVTNAIKSTSDLIDDDTFDLNGFAETIGSLAGTGTVEDTSATASTLTTNGDNASTVFSGTLANGTGVLSLTKTGTGTLTLSGTNTYTGTTTESAGTLEVDGAQSSSAISLHGGTLTGTGTVGPIASASSGSTLGPGNPLGVLTAGNISLATGAPTFSLQLNGPNAGTDYDQLQTAGTIALTNAVLSVNLGFTPTSGQVFTILDNTGTHPIVGSFSGLPEGATISIDGSNFTISYVGGGGHSVTLTAGNPSVALAMAVTPTSGAVPGTNLSYTVRFTNTGVTAASQVVIADAVPTYTSFKVGSATDSLGSTGLSDVISYSNDGGATYTYTPVSGGGGAPAGYDALVTNVRWALTGSLSWASPNNAGSVTMIARIQ